MNLLTIFIIVTGFLLTTIIVLIILSRIDWRAFFVRRYGHNYKLGLAHTCIDDTWVYRESRMYFKGDDAISYSREVEINGERITVEDIVPNSIGFEFDEYTGARVYRIQPGGCIGTSDRGGVPAVDYPEQLISVHVADRTVSKYARTVSADEGHNWAPLLIVGGIIAVIAIVAVVLFATGTITPPGTAPGVSDNATNKQITQETEEEPDVITGPVEIKK